MEREREMTLSEWTPPAFPLDIKASFKGLGANIVQAE